MGQSPSSRCKHYKARLVKAVKTGDLKTARKLLGKGLVSINNVKDARGCPVLCLAVRKEDLEMVSLLIKEGVVQKGGIRKGWRLDIPSNPEEVMLTKLLVNLDADAPFCEEFFSPSLSEQSYHCSRCKNGASLEKDEVVNIDVTDKKGLSPIHITAINGAKDIARVLIDTGADVNKADTLEASPLHAAAAYAHEDICRLLLDNGALPNACEKSGLTPLHLAVMTGGVGSARILLNHGAWPHVPDHEGRSPMHFSAVLSAFRGLDDVVRTNRSLILNLLLLQHGGCITFQDDSKCSPLSYALIKDNIRLVRMYLDFGLRLEQDDHKRLLQKHPKAAAKYEEELEEEPDTKVPSLYRCCRRSIMSHLATRKEALTDSKLYNYVMEFELPRSVENFLKYKS